VIRQNRDTQYSPAVFDLDAGPVTITLPDAGDWFMSMQVIDQDEYTHQVIYNEGLHTFTREQIGTRYVATPVRILVNPNDPADMAAVHWSRWGTLPDTKGMFGTKKDTDPVRHLPGAANAWGGNPERDALYLTVVPPRHDGTTIHRLPITQDGTTPFGCTGRNSRSWTTRGRSRRLARSRAPARWSRRSCGPAGRGAPARRLGAGSAH
jgi:Protein of unknown function (DUF1254)